MKSSLRHAALCVLAATLAALVLGAPAAAPDTGLQNVALACDDGTNLALSLDAASLTQLTNAVTAMTLFPAGLSCSVSPDASAPSPDKPKHDYAVGGGQQFSATAMCTINFAFSAHTQSEGPAQGSFNESIPGGCPFATGQLRTTVFCLHVTVNHADMIALVNKATGFFSNFDAIGDAFISVTDNKNLLLPLPDMLGATPVPTKTTSPDCYGTDEAAITNGNINVREAS